MGNSSLNAHYLPIFILHLVAIVRLGPGGWNVGHQKSFEIAGSPWQPTDGSPLGWVREQVNTWSFGVQMELEGRGRLRIQWSEGRVVKFIQESETQTKFPKQTFTGRTQDGSRLKILQRLSL